MSTHTARDAEKRTLAGTPTIPTPSSFVEYGFYFYMFFNILGGVFGLSTGNFAPAMLVVLFIVCLRNLGPQIIPVIRAVAFPMGCAVAFVFIQLVFFDESSTQMLMGIRPFIPWMLLLVLVQSLVLRENFLRRFILVMFVLGVIALPYITLNNSATSGGMMARAGLDRGIGFAGSNGMGEWYGFCALGFVVMAFATRKNTLRILSLLIAIGCLYVMTLTVSRGAVLAVAVGIVLAGRHWLKMGFLPILLLVCIGWGIVELGVFEQSTQSYVARGTEDTGRLAVWPLIIDSFLASPLIGVGDANVGAVPEGASRLVKPHNSFLYLAQSSGIVPLALFIAYWLRSARSALREDVRNSPDAAFYIPLLCFTFVTVNLSGLTFMQLWAIVSLAIPMTASVQRQALDLPGRRF